MNYTQNHHLPQWVESDPIRMKDFNQMNQDIETGRDAAVSKANAAQAAADKALAKSGEASRNFLTGTYTGNGQDQEVNITFRPGFLLISRVDATGDHDFAIVGAGNQNNRCQITSKGFKVFAPDPAHPEYPDLNKNQKRYEFIAFV